MKKYLLTPGPVELPAAVRNAEAEQLISHRGKAFYELFERVENKLQQLFQSKSPVVLLPSSGTGALECAAVNFLKPGDKFISFSCGTFGDRFREIAKRTGAQAICCDIPMGEAPTAEMTAELCAEHPDAAAVLVTHNETSSAVTVPLKELLAAVPRERRPLVMVDGVSSVGTIEILPEQWGADVVCTASQKGLMTPPGLGLLWLSERAVKAALSNEPRSYYFDLRLHLKNMRPGAMANPYTPPVSLYFALDSALSIILKDGAGKWFEKRRHFAQAFAAAAEGCGYGLFVKKPELRSAGLTAMTAPSGADSEIIRGRLLEAGFETAGGMGAMQGRLIRAAHYTDWDFEDLKNIVGALAAAAEKEELCPDALKRAHEIYLNYDADEGNR